MGFFVKLIGWWAVLAGLFVPLVFQPLNAIAARHYYTQQSAVMAARDSKTHVVTEALQEIRQINFSALEDQWQKVSWLHAKLNWTSSGEYTFGVSI